MTRQRKNMPPNNAERTNYPKVFNHCYWGHGTYDWEQDVWDNRNTLGKELNILHCPNYSTLLENHHPLAKERGGCGWWGDHSEFYRIAESSSRVILISPYRVEPEQHEVLTSEGWTKIKSMYGNGSVTYMKIVSSIKKGATIMDVPDTLRFNVE